MEPVGKGCCGYNVTIYSPTFVEHFSTLGSFLVFPVEEPLKVPHSLTAVLFNNFLVTVFILLYSNCSGFAMVFMF